MRWTQTVFWGSLAAFVIGATPSWAQTPRPATAPSSGGAARPAQSKAAPTQAAAVAPKPVDPEAAAKMEALLKKWEANSATVTKLDVLFTRIDTERGWGKTTYEGRAVLQSPNLAWVDLQKSDVDPKTTKKELKPHERIISTGKEVWQYFPPVKQIIIHALAAEERQRAMDEGPLPFLFNMKAEQAKKRYKMTLTSETPEVYVIKIIPLMAIDLEAFEEAFAQLDKVTLQPRQLRLVDKTRDTKDYWFTKMESNPTTDFSKFFVGEKYTGWTVERNEANKAQGTAVGQRPPTAGARQPIGAPKARK